ncbi:MAG: YdgA family protein [Steroidobacteraceae bacterium]
MATRLRIVLIAVVVVLAAYTGAAWLIGLKVQGQLEAREQQILQSVPYVVLIRRDYHRGIFGATEEATYGLKFPLGRLSQALPAGGTSPSLQLTLRNTIYHGPLPRFRSIALATVDTEFVAPPALGAKLKAIFGDRPPIAIHSSLGWLGGTKAEFSSPGFQMPLPTGGTLTSRGLTGSVEMTRDSASWTGHFTSGGVDVQGPRGSLDIGNFTLDENMRRAFDTIYVGDGQASLASVDVRGASGAPFLMKGLSISSSAKADSEYVNYDVRVVADQVSGGTYSFTHVVYAIRILHLDGSALASLVNAIRQAEANSAPADAAAVRANINGALSQYGVELLVHDPVIHIQSLAFAMPEGEFHLAASLEAHGIRRGDLAGGMASMLALTQHLDVTADLKIDAALLSKLVGSSAQGPMLSAQLDSLEKQGYLKRDGAAWTAQLAFHGGKLTINGQAYPPLPSQ